MPSDSAEVQKIAMCEYDGTAVFVSTAGDELDQSEIVEDQISNYSDQNLIVNYSHSIFQESACSTTSSPGLPST